MDEKLFENNLKLLSKASDKLIYKIAQKYEMSVIELNILLFFKFNMENNLAKDIVDYLGTTKSHVSKAINNLIDKKMIIRVPDDSDNKKLHLILTDKTKEVIDTAIEERKKIKNILLDGISDQDVITLKRIINKMYENINSFINNREE